MGSYGGGLCQLSNMLFMLFLHSPLTIIERHGHSTLSLPPAEPDSLCGVDATIYEGWLDLKVKNETDHTFQIVISFDEERMYGKIMSEIASDMEYSLYNNSVSYIRQGDCVWQKADVWRMEKSIVTGEETRGQLYVNQCRIGYELSGVGLLEEG